MAKKVDLQKRLNMRFLTVSYEEKQETYGTCTDSANIGSIALDILNLPDFVLEELLEQKSRSEDFMQDDDGLQECIPCGRSAQGSTTF